MFCPRVLLVVIVFLGLNGSISAQEYYADIGNVSTEQVSKVYRLQRRLPAFYTGFAIEVATSEFPVQKDHPIYSKFGKIYYHKLRHGGYSYLIQTPFSDFEAVKDFFESTIKSKVGHARIIKYRKGKRKIKATYSS